MNKNKSFRSGIGGGRLLCKKIIFQQKINRGLRRMFLILTMLLSLSIVSFSEIPHSYVSENPDRAISKVETIKEREKAELNLSVTKKKSKEIEGFVDENSKQILLKIPQEIKDKPLIVVEGLEELPNPSTVKGRKILSRALNNKPVSNNLVQEQNNNDLIVKYQAKPKELYISDFNGNFYRFRESRGYEYENGYRVFRKQEQAVIEIDNRYKKEWINLGTNYQFITSVAQPIGVRVISSNPSRLKANGAFNIYSGSPNLFDIAEFKRNSNINSFMRLKSYPQHDFSIFYVHRYHDQYGGGGGGNGSSHGSDPQTVIVYRTTTFYFKYIVRTLEGQSVLEAKEYYPVNEFIKFNSTTMEQGSPLALENSLKDVSLNTTGKGIVTMEQGDKLEIDGKTSIVGAGGNLAEQTSTVGDLRYTYKVENGKLRVALNNWGVLEPNHNLMIRVFRTKDGAESKLVEHTLTIKAPRKVEGNSELKYDNDYPIRTFVRFNGISLTAPSSTTLEMPVPSGVSLSSQAGQGIPFMNEGDIFQVNDGVTRKVHQFTIGANGTLAKKQIKFNNSDVTFYVENGKLRVGLNNWEVNKPVKLNLRLIRGTNKIMSYVINFKVPEAPFNIKKNGILDFGKVTSGSKRTAETDIVLEMLKDVEEVKFNLRDRQPLMENANGKTLKVNDIQTLVRKQGERTYLVKLVGKLIIPENTQMGEYSGTTILELRIK